MEYSALIGYEIVRDFYKAILKEVEKLGGTEEDMIEVLEITNKHELSKLVARVLTHTYDVKEMSWMSIVMSSETIESVKLNALQYINNDIDLIEIAKANVELPHGAVSLGTSKNSGKLNRPWPEQPNIVSNVLSKLSYDSLLKLIDGEDPDNLTDEGLMRAALSTCIYTSLYNRTSEIIKKTNSLAVLSQLNLNKDIRDLPDTYTVALGRMRELNLNSTSIVLYWI